MKRHANRSVAMKAPHTHTHSPDRTHAYKLCRGEPVKEERNCTVITCHSSTSHGSCPASVSIAEHLTETENPHIAMLTV